jgi:hypothetical protein
MKTPVLPALHCAESHECHEARRLAAYHRAMNRRQRCLFLLLLVIFAAVCRIFWLTLIP